MTYKSTATKSAGATFDAKPSLAQTVDVETFEASAIRNIVRLADLQPIFMYAVGLIAIVANSRGKR